MGKLVDLWTIEQVAKELGKTVQTLYNWRWQGKGPKYVKIGNRVMYRPEDIAAFIMDSIHEPVKGGLKAARKAKVEAA